MKPPDLYATLKVKRTATPAAIRKAYGKLAMKHHPDRCPGDPDAKARMQAVQLAFDVLSDPKRRAQYDADGTVDRITADYPQAACAEVLSQVLHAVVQGIGSRGGDPAAEDVLAMMHSAIKNGLATFLNLKQQTEAARKLLAATAKRFASDDGDAIMEDIVQGGLAGMDGELRRLESDAAKLREAQAFLKKYKYQFTRRIANITFTPIMMIRQ